MHYLQFHGKEGDDAGRENFFFRENGCLFVMQWKEDRERAAERLFGLKSKISDFFKFLLYLSDKKKAGKMHPPPFSPPLNNFCLEPFFKKRKKRKKVEAMLMFLNFFQSFFFSNSIWNLKEVHTIHWVFHFRT